MLPLCNLSLFSRLSLRFVNIIFVNVANHKLLLSSTFFKISLCEFAVNQIICINFALNCVSPLNHAKTFIANIMNSESVGLFTLSDT